MCSAAEVIRDERDEIIRLWFKAANRTHVSDRFSPAELVANLPELLSIVAAHWLDAPREFARAAQKEIASHVVLRQRQGFEVADVVSELSVLGRCVVDAWSSSPRHGGPTCADVQALYGHLSAASVAVAEIFHMHEVNEEQVEKETMRLMSAIAHRALSSESARLQQDRLDDLLSLIARALGAQTVAVRVQHLNADGTMGALLATSAVGNGRDALQRFAADEPLLAAPIVAASARLATPPPFPRARKAGAINDRELDVNLPSAAEVHVGEELWHRGVRALLAVRTSRHALVSAMYVGMATAHAFSSREFRRAEALGEWLTILLDNAVLHGCVTAQSRSLDLEREMHDRLVSIVAHDLRGPLTAAKLCAELLARINGAHETNGETTDPSARSAERSERSKRSGEGSGEGSAETRLDGDRVVGSIVSSLTRCDRMLTDFVDAHRLQAGQSLLLALGPCNLQEICELVAREMQPLIGDRALLILSPVTGMWCRRELQRAVSNLLMSALRFGERGSTITISARAVVGGAEVVVHCFGQPIDPDALKTIFQPFARANDSGAAQVGTRTGTREGFGLALALVKGCADAHGGSVDVTSDRGGTTFTMRLPLDARNGAPTFERPALDSPRRH